MKRLARILFFVILVINMSVFADRSSFRDYDADYYLDEGKLLFKLRPIYANVSGNQKGFENFNSTSRKPGDLIKNGYGFDTATTYFLTDYIAAELSAGLIYFKSKKATVKDTASFFGNPNVQTSKGSNIWMVPVSGTLQYHVAPFGAIRPYLGLGLHGTYVYSRSKEFSVGNGAGAVLQAGIDFVSRDDTLITLDVRQYSLESKINYKSSFTGLNRDFSTKAKWNPIVISLGFGFVF